MALTFNEWVALLQGAVKYAETLRQVGSTVTDDLLGQADAYISLLEGSTDAAIAAGDAMRTTETLVSNTISQGAEPLIAATILMVRPVIGAPEADLQGTIDRLYTYMDDNSASVNARNFSRGSFSAAGGNTGDGTFLRVTTDADGYLMERGLAQTINAECVRNASGSTTDAGKTDAGREVFSIWGEPQGSNELDYDASDRGTGGPVDVACVSSDDSIVNNASFGQFTGTTSVPTSIIDWTVTNDIANLEIDQTNFYVAALSETTPGSLKFTASDTISQALSVQGSQLNGSVPYICQIAWNREVGSASGTLTLHCGSVSVNVAVSAQTGWQILRVTPGQNSWPVNWEEQASTDIKVEWSRTGGDILVDDLRVAPYPQPGGEFINGTPIIGLGGQTRWALRDSGTFSDTVSGAIIQRWIDRTAARYLPSENTGSETISDPTITF